ncbi:MAG TPA: FAD-dependent oxidoreductase [Acidimicrobiales bacterium]|nr:FAD-dependent oxidoreductase [Acidimicrobiales bacterium]
MTLVEPSIERTKTTLPHVTVLTDRCAGCQECVIRCPTGALSMDTGRWVAVADDRACVGCRQCVRTCPFSAIEVEGPLVVGERTAPSYHHPEVLLGDDSEVRQGFSTWSEALAEAQRCLSCPDPTCVRGCPAHNDIPGFISALRDGDLGRAHEVLRATTVMPDVCSRVCNQAAQCEGACSWSLAGGMPVAIGRLERFVADNAPVAPPPAPPTERSALSVGIVGSGPAAIGAAWELVAAGAEVTVYEKDAVPGGLLIWGIPDFTLPGAVANRPWAQLEAAGVELRCGQEVRPEDLPGLLGDHDGLVLAHGASVPLRLSVPGADLAGVTDATRFLQGAKAVLEGSEGPDVFLGSLGLADRMAAADGRPARVLVLGAGNTAMDVARSARRLGLQPTCIDWLDERFALARPDELAEARAEGVDIRFCATLTSLEGEGGRVARAAISRTTQPRADRRPKIVSGATEVLAVDLVVMAMGYRNDPAFSASLPGTPLRREQNGIPDRRWTASGVLAGPASEFAYRYPVGRLALGREVGLQRARFPHADRVWVAGDALVGPSTVVEAMAQGRRAARALLAARPVRPGRPKPPPERVLVCYESRSGHTAGAAELVAGVLALRASEVTLLPMSKVGPDELAGADLVVVGSWVEGLLLAKVGPARAARRFIEQLPPLAGKRAAVFCTYAVSPRSALEEMVEIMEKKGAQVVTSAALPSRGTAADASAFAEDVLAICWPDSPARPPSRALSRRQHPSAAGPSLGGPSRNGSLQHSRGPRGRSRP